MLLFAASGEVAYWLRRSVTIKQDRGLLPFDAIGPDARDTTAKYLKTILRKGGMA